MHVWRNVVIIFCWGFFFEQPKSFVCGYTLTILHTNDVHDRFQQTNGYGGTCSTKNAAEGKCFGGFSRLMTKVNEIRNQATNVILLDGGDQFVGTLWYGVFNGTAASHFMNRLRYDAMSLGNHEFDEGEEGLAQFLDNVTFPVLGANIDLMTSQLQGRIARSTMLVVGGETIGLVGYITQDTAFISKPGPNVKFTDVVTAVTEEVNKLRDSGVNKIIAVGHAGYPTDKLVAAIEGVDVVVGGHTNTFLYTGQAPSSETVAGMYPTVVARPSGSAGLVVQAYAFGKYLGHLEVTFDDNGNIEEYRGNPILLDKSVPQDPGLQAELDQWQTQVDNLTSETFGYTNVLLGNYEDRCRLYECNMGNLITDSAIAYHLSVSHSNSTWAPAALAVWNGGGIRTSLSKGPINVGHISTVLPFRNEVEMVTVTGSNLRDQLELSVQDWNTETKHGRFLQFSGFHVTYDLSKPNGSRVVSVDVRCLDCDIPSYSPLKNDALYKVLVPSFLLGGGDGYSFKPQERVYFGSLDTDIVIDYIRRRSPIFPDEEGRIKFFPQSTASIVAPRALLVAIATFFVVFTV